MAAKYDFYKTPVSKDSMKRPRFHARIVSSGTIDTDDLAKRIHEIGRASCRERV